MTDSKCRIDFEGRALNIWLWGDDKLQRLPLDNYANESTEEAWQTWQAAHEMYAPKWISVEDRLPDEAQVILVKDRIEMIFKATFIRGQFPLFDTHRCVSDVTHWMPASQLGDKE